MIDKKIHRCGVPVPPLLRGGYTGTRALRRTRGTPGYTPGTRVHKSLTSGNEAKVIGVPLSPGVHLKTFLGVPRSPRGDRYAQMRTFRPASKISPQTPPERLAGGLWISSPGRPEKAVPRSSGLRVQLPRPGGRFWAATQQPPAAGGRFQLALSLRVPVSAPVGPLGWPSRVGTPPYFVGDCRSFIEGPMPPLLRRGPKIAQRAAILRTMVGRAYTDRGIVMISNRKKL